MKLLLDENISVKLVKFIVEKFPESSHIDLLNMQGATDSNIWEHAKAGGYIIVSKDNDFRQKSFLFGAPPKVVWLSVGNGNTAKIKALLLNNIAVIRHFIDDPNESLLILKPPK